MPKKNEVHVIVEVGGGVIHTVYANQTVRVNVIDWDNLDQEDDPELEAEYNRLKTLTETMKEVW
jgi:hypothetical protein